MEHALCLGPYQRFVMYVSVCNWFVLGLEVQISDWNPMYTLYMRNEFELSAYEIGSALAVGPIRQAHIIMRVLPLMALILVPTPGGAEGPPSAWQQTRSR